MAKRQWDDHQISQFEHEIAWLRERLDSVGPKQRQEYERQIRKKELEIAFNRSETP